jgi:ribosome biogenesis GTPase A
MAKTMRLLEDNLKLCDMVLYVLDARIPEASLNPALTAALGGKPIVYLLNKSDLADPVVTARWVQRLSTGGNTALSVNATAKSGRRAIVQAATAAAQEKIDRRAAKGVKYLPKTMVVGIPNAGKSTIINMLSGAAPTKTGDRPGVTRGKQWVKIGEQVELLDMPGALPPKFDNQRLARHAAYVGSINDDVLDGTALAAALIAEVHALYPFAIAGRYAFTPTGDAEADLAAVARARGFLLPGGVADIDRAALAVIDDLRKGKLGRITFVTAYGGGSCLTTKKTT